MNVKIKKLLAALLLIVSSLFLLSLTKDRFMKLFIITCILFSSIYVRKRNLRKLERKKRAAQEIEDEEMKNEKVE